MTGAKAGAGAGHTDRSSLGGAFAFLITRSFFNRLRSMARKVRRPVYALGMIVGVVYVGALLWSSTMASSAGSGAPPGLLENESLAALAPLGLVMLVAGAWLFGSNRSALAFTMPEVALLFPAPVPRRAMVLYKIANAQVPIVFNAVILALLFGRTPEGVPRILAVVSLYAMFATIHLHRLGASLVRAASAEHGLVGVKRNWIANVASTGAVLVLVLATLPALSERGTGGDPLGIVKAMAEAVSAPLPKLVLTPFAMVMAPAFAKSVDAWVWAMIPALAILALHVVWVLRTEVAFEEAAVEASTKQHAMIEKVRTRGVSAVHQAQIRAKRTLPLAPTGHPAIALVWKNMLNLGRTFRPTQYLWIMIMPVFAGIAGGGRMEDPAFMVGILCGMAVVLLLVTGGLTVRNDLRGDLLNLESVKTWPLRGREIVFASVCSSALPIAALQLLLFWTGLGALQMSAKPMPPGLAITLAVTAPAALAALTICMNTLQNGLAVMLPAWSRLGGSQSVQGMEVLGQAILGLLALFLTFLLCLVVPAIVAAVVLTMLKPPAVLAATVIILAGAAALVAESYGLAVGLGKRLDQLEPSDVR